LIGKNKTNLNAQDLKKTKSTRTSDRPEPMYQPALPGGSKPMSPNDTGGRGGDLK